MFNQLFSTASLESERQRFVSVLMVVMTRAPLTRKSSFGGHATTSIKPLEFSFLQQDSGSSNKNRVELQNGCLVLAHSNLFIPSTLNGSCLDLQSGNIDEAKLKRNLSDA